MLIRELLFTNRLASGIISNRGGWGVGVGGGKYNVWLINDLQ